MFCRDSAKGNKLDLISKLKQSVQYYFNGTEEGFLRYNPRPSECILLIFYNIVRHWYPYYSGWFLLFFTCLLHCNNRKTKNIIINTIKICTWYKKYCEKKKKFYFSIFINFATKANFSWTRLEKLQSLIVRYKSEVIGSGVPLFNIGLAVGTAYPLWLFL